MKESQYLDTIWAGVNIQLSLTFILYVHTNLTSHPYGYIIIQLLATRTNKIALTFNPMTLALEIIALIAVILGAVFLGYLLAQ